LFCIERVRKQIDTFDRVCRWKIGEQVGQSAIVVDFAIDADGVGVVANSVDID
jgi:hypothetical protein